MAEIVASHAGARSFSSFFFIFVRKWNCDKKRKNWQNEKKIPFCSNIHTRPLDWKQYFFKGWPYSYPKSPFTSWHLTNLQQRKSHSLHTLCDEPIQLMISRGPDPRCHASKAGTRIPTRLSGVVATRGHPWIKCCFLLSARLGLTGPTGIFFSWFLKKKKGGGVHYF